MNTNIQNDDTRPLIICIPYAGQGAGMYQEVKQHFQLSLNLLPLKLPGRDDRIFEKPAKSIDDLLPDLYLQCQTYLDRPFAFFGHCMGGLIAYELALKFKQELNIEAEALFVSSCPAPNQINIEHPAHLLSDERFIDRIQQIGQPPAEALDRQGKMVLSTLKADFELFETYTPKSSSKLNCPIYISCGEDDVYISSNLTEGWSNFTRESTKSYAFPGNHFYVHTHLKTLLEEFNNMFYH